MELSAQEEPPHATLLGCSFQNLLLRFSLTDASPLVCWEARGGQSSHSSPYSHSYPAGFPKTGAQELK